jgi:hypothetical protein
MMVDAAHVSVGRMRMSNKASTESHGQYSLAKILGLWVAVSAPMGILAWIVYPALKDSVSMYQGIFLWILMITGLMWEVVLSLAILYRETGTLNLGAIRGRTWRQGPRDPIHNHDRNPLRLPEQTIPQRLVRPNRA